MFNFVRTKVYKNEEIFSLLRILNGVSLIIYYASVLLPNFGNFFTIQGFVDPSLFNYYKKSWLFYFWGNDLFFLFLFFLTFILLFTYTIGYFAKWSVLILIPIHVGFHTAVPFINHEPQPLTNLLLVLTAFLPIEKAWSIKKKEDVFPPLSNKHGESFLKIMLFYFSLYYFFSGLKKIPETSWVDGTAVKAVLTFPFLGKRNFLADFFKIDFVSTIATIFTLFFEIGFLFIAFSRFRKILIPIGVIFHLMIGLTIDVGLFFWTMISWYPLLLIHNKVE